jgi:hypothetical protein
VLLAGGGAGAFVVTHPKEVLQVVGMVAKAAPDTTTRLDASVPVDTLPEVAVIPQGTGAVDTTTAPTAPAVVDSQAHTEPPPPVHVEPPASAHVEPGAAARIDPSAAARGDVAPTRATPAPPPEKAHPVLPVGRARLTHAAVAGDARDSGRAAQSGSAAAPNVRDSVTAPPPNELHHPWLRANGDSTAARIIDNSSSPDERLQALIEEMQGHLALGNRHTTRGDLNAARRAYREAGEEGGVIKLTFPGALVAGRVDGILLNGMRQAFQLCQAARPDSTSAAAGGECGSLFAR